MFVYVVLHSGFFLMRMQANNSVILTLLEIMKSLALSSLKMYLEEIEVHTGMWVKSQK